MQLKNKSRENLRVDELPQNISSKMFCWRSISKRDEIMSSFSLMHRIKEIHVDIPASTTSLLIYLWDTNCLVSGQGIPKALFSYFLKKMYAGALSNVNDSFILSRLMKRPPKKCDPARDEYP